MHDNPVRKGFVEKPKHWKYSRARNWLLDDDSVIAADRRILFGEGLALPVVRPGAEPQGVQQCRFEVPPGDQKFPSREDSNML
jgi:hypothetical protein